LRMIIFVIVKKIVFQIMQRFPNSCTPKNHQTCGRHLMKKTIDG
jgi:hypothetical protein